MAADISFYGLLYEFHRTSTNGADILITIEKKWYEGEVKQRALGRAPVIKRENKDHIFGTSCELYAECLVDGEYADMYTSDPYEFRVSVYKDETLLWQGFVSPELYSEPDAAPPYDVQITATDGLGELKNSIYEERGAASILSHIMGLIGQYPIYVISGLRYVDSTGAISQDHDILNVRINLDHEKGNSKYDVLQNLLTSLNANITQLNGRYVIFRETDFINKATDEGVEAFDVNGEKVYISIASFGSMNSHQWWPIGQLSTVVEPAKNSLVLQAPNHYKDNVLDFSQWSILNSAEYDATEDAYILPDEGSYITQALDFDNEVDYRLGLRIRARNVGDSEEDQNIGLMIKVNARTYAAPEGRDFWLVKSEVSTGNARTDYLWRGQEDYFEEVLNMPSDADTASDAQNVDIVIPLYDHSQNGLSYIFASSLSIKIFNPAGIHDIYVYDVSLVKYEQSEGYEAKVVINNAAREAESDIDLSMSSASFAPAAGNMFMTGLPMQADGLLIEQWQIPGSAAQEYLSAMSYDYARAVALPKMKYSGVLNVPDTATILPILFLRDGTYYFPKTYTYDLYNDEIQVELISISAADVSLSSVVISQYAESSGNMGGVTTGGGGGGSVVSLPRDKVMSDTSDNAVENRVIKAYVDSEVKDIADLLTSMWRIEDNKIVTNMDVLVKANLIVEKDTSSGGSGSDTPASGTVTGIKVSASETLTPNNAGIIDMVSVLSSIDVSDQLKDYAKLRDIPTIYILTLKKADGSNLVVFDPEKENKVVTLDKAVVGLGYVENKSSATIRGEITSANVTSALRYTPLSTGGGTMTGPLGITASTKPTGNIGFWSAGDIGFIMAKSSLQFYKANTQEYFDIIHSGNYSSYALPLSGGTIASSSTDTPLTIKNNNSSGAWIGFNNANGNLGYIGYSYEKKLYCYDENGTTRIVLHSGNIGSYKAGGLATPRTIWGQSFDGTMNVSGALYLSNESPVYFKDTAGNNVAGLYVSSGNNMWMGYHNGTSIKSCIAGSEVRLYYGGNSKIGLLLNSSGNVTIGDSDLAGTSARLAVNGKTRIYRSSSTTEYLDISVADVQVTYNAYDPDGYSNHYFQSNGTTRLAILGNSGNVGIGTTDPQYKLDVAGTGRFTGAVTMSNELFLGNNMGIYFKNTSGTNALAMYVSPSNVLQVGYNNVDSVAFQKPVTMSSTLSVKEGVNAHGQFLLYTTDDAYRLTVYEIDNIARLYNIDSAGQAYGNMYIGQNSTGAIVIKDGSYVGVGATPSGNYKLEVNGQIFTNSTLFTPAIYGGPSSALKWRLTNDASSNGLWLQAALADLSSNKGKMYLSGINGVNLTELNLYADNTKASKVTLSVSLTTPVISATGGLDIVANNSAAGSRLYLTTNVFRPWGDDAGLIDLGASNIQWRNVYAVNGIFSGDTSSGSDIRFKDIIKNKTLKIEHIAKAPLFTFKWNDREDDTIHLGSSAQYWEKVTPWLVKGEDFKTLDYSTLGVAMGISLAKKAVNHEERIKVLEKENKALKAELNRISYGGR